MRRKHRHRPPRRTRIRIPHRPIPASPPGSAGDRPTENAVEANWIAFDAEHLSEGTLEAEHLPNLFGTRAAVRWIDLESTSSSTLLGALARHFGWHPLTVEDVISGHQRPKTEDFDDHAYVVVHMPSDGDGLRLEQLNLLFGADYVVTVQGGQPGDTLELIRKRLREGRGRARSSGGDYLAYAIVDAVVDHYFPVVEGINERLEALELRVDARDEGEVMAELHGARNDLHTLWRTLTATRESIGRLARGEAGCVQDTTRLYLRDCQDHCAQLLDAVVACQHLSSSLMELHQATVNLRLNETMRVLTMIATIFIPISFIASLYGMNFDRGASSWNMPELGWVYGYPFALGLMLVVALAFLVQFARRGWLGRRGRPRAEG